LQDIIIQQLKNPQKLETFMINDQQDIDQDIKNADSELNDDCARQFIEPYLQEKMVELNLQPRRKAEIDEAFRDRDMGLVSAIGCYNFRDDQNQRKTLIHNLKSDPEMKRQFSFDSSAIYNNTKNYKKQNLAQTTHKHTATRENIRNGAFR